MNIEGFTWKIVTFCEIQVDLAVKVLLCLNGRTCVKWSLLPSTNFVKRDRSTNIGSVCVCVHAAESLTLEYLGCMQSFNY